MAEITNQLITKIARGVPVRFYIRPTINADGTITLMAGGGLDSTAHANAKEIGFTQEGVEMTRGVAFEDLPVDQRNNNILQSLTSQDVHLKTNVLQIRDYDNVVKLNPGTVAMTGTGFSGISDQLVQTFDLIPVCAIAPTPNDATKFLVLILYACYNVAPFNVKLAKQYNTTPIDLKAQDAGRSDGKTWAFYETVA
jgi:hypothetical protein